TGLIAAGENLRCCLALFYALASPRAESRLPIPCYKRACIGLRHPKLAMRKPGSQYMNHWRFKEVNPRGASIVKYFEGLGINAPGGQRFRIARTLVIAGILL